MASLSAQSTSAMEEGVTQGEATVAVDIAAVAKSEQEELPRDKVTWLLGSDGRASGAEEAQQPTSPGAWARIAKFLRLMNGDRMGTGMGMGMEMCEDICEGDVCDGDSEDRERAEHVRAKLTGAPQPQPQPQPHADGGGAITAAAGAEVEQSVTSRASCLIILLLFQSSSSVVLEHFKMLMRYHPSIIFFLTMLVGAGGNAGCQSAVQVVRQITLAAATGKTSDRPSACKILGAEMSIGARLALVLSIVSICRCLLFNVERDEVIAITLSLIAIVFASTSVGAALPLILEKVGLDPGHAGAAVQVLMDIGGVTLTCVISSLVLGLPLSGDEPPAVTTGPPSQQLDHKGHFLRHRVSQ